jgi:hypothetical protein
MSAIGPPRRAGGSRCRRLSCRNGTRHLRRSGETDTGAPRVRRGKAAWNCVDFCARRVKTLLHAVYSRLIINLHREPIETRPLAVANARAIAVPDIPPKIRKSLRSGAASHRGRVRRHKTLPPRPSPTRRWIWPMRNPYTSNLEFRRSKPNEATQSEEPSAAAQSPPVEVAKLPLRNGDELPSAAAAQPSVKTEAPAAGKDSSAD